MHDQHELVSFILDIIKYSEVASVEVLYFVFIFLIMFIGTCTQIEVMCILLACTEYCIIHHSMA